MKPVDSDDDVPISDVGSGPVAAYFVDCAIFAGAAALMVLIWYAFDTGLFANCLVG